LRTRSQRTLKKHNKSPLFLAIDSLLFFLKFKLGGLVPANPNMAENKGTSPVTPVPIGVFLEQVKYSGIGIENFLDSPVMSQISVILAPNTSDSDDDEDDSQNRLTNNSEKLVLLAFQFDDSFQRHLLHAVAEYYDLVSFSRMCHHKQDDNDASASASSSTCPRVSTHRVTIVHGRSKTHEISKSCSSSSSSSTSSSLNLAGGLGSDEGTPLSLAEFLGTYCSE